MATQNFDERQWVIRVSAELNADDQPCRKSHCIFRAPRVLLNENEKAYVPQVVSLGPYHFGDPKLAAMEIHKSEAVRRIQRRNEGNNFNSIVREIKAMDRQIRECYDEEIQVGDEALSWMMARDASFILEFLRFFILPIGTELIASNGYHPIFSAESSNSELGGILQDLFKVGNQIPVFVMEKVLEMELDSHESAMNKLQHALKLFFIKFNPISTARYRFEILYEETGKREKEIWKNKIASTDSIASDKQIETAEISERPMTSRRYSSNSAIRGRHILENFHEYIIGEYEEGNTAKYQESAELQSAVESFKQGIKFKGYDGLIDKIQFNLFTSTLSLPRIRLDETTEVIIRNLVAFEGCCSSCEVKGVTAYAQFMDSLLDTEADIALMRKHKIIINTLGSDVDAARLFNTVGQLTWTCNYGPVNRAEGLMLKYYNQKMRTLWGEFLQANCSKPWFVISGFAAFALLVMTVLQVLCLFHSCNSKSSN